MMRLIHKYQIPGAGAGPIQMPKGAHCLHAREQNNVACIWALIDPEQPMEPRTFAAVETGSGTVPIDSRYLGAALLDGGAYVLHIFELATLKG